MHEARSARHCRFAAGDHLTAPNSTVPIGVIALLGIASNAGDARDNMPVPVVTVSSWVRMHTDTGKRSEAAPLPVEREQPM